MAEKKEKSNNRKRKFALKVAGVVLLVLILTLGGAFAVCMNGYRNKILPNVYVNDISVQGQSRDQLGELIKKLNDDSASKSIKVVSGDKSWEMKFSDLGWKLDQDAMVEQIYSYGHGQDTIQNILAFARVGFKKVEYEPIFSFDENLAYDWLLSINSEIGTPKTEANIQVKDGKAEVINPASGKEINITGIKQAMYERLSLKSTGDIQAELAESAPTISAEEAAGLSGKAIELTSGSLELIGPKASLKWDSNTLGKLIEIKKKEKKNGFLQSSTYSEAYVSFDEDKISSLLEAATQDLNNDPVEAKFTVIDGVVTIESPSQGGEVIDLSKAKTQIVEVLEANKDKKVDLPTKVQAASIEAKIPSDIAKYGIKELIGTATTTFSGSSANRIHNIKTGTQAISGALIKPGEEFSTNGHLGTINASTGYLQEMVIKENKTVAEYGGGLCQVASTLFRTALQSGLEITERHNHSYRVSYYEPPVGMDATIYSPSVDLKFVNNTASYILVQGRVEGTKVTFDFYGTKDGRTIEISDPYVYDEVPAPDPVYIDDPSLAPGEEKRIDRAHPGAKASFTYKVTKDGKELTNKTFKSTYVPWAAKYLRGPAKEGDGT